MKIFNSLVIAGALVLTISSGADARTFASNSVAARTGAVPHLMTGRSAFVGGGFLRSMQSGFGSGTETICGLDLASECGGNSQ